MHAMGGGSTRSATRLLIAAAVVVTVVMVVAPAERFMSRSTIGLVQVLLPLGAVGWFAAAMIRQRRHGPARFVVLDGAFVAPRNMAFGFYVVGQLFLLAVLGERTVAVWADDVAVGAPRWADDVLAVWMSLLVGPLMLLHAVLVVTALRDRPVLVLTADGLVVRDPFSVRRYPWEALAQRGHDPRAAWPPVVRPDLVARRGVALWGPRAALGFADVHPWFFADAVRLYLLRPDRRSGIGTREEHDRLLVDLRVLVPAN
jgi:hypothetical protein